MTSGKISRIDKMTKFYRMPTYVCDLIMRDLSLGEIRLLNAVVRLTIGFGRESYQIPMKQLMDLTGLTKKTLLEARKSLQKRKLVKVCNNGNEAATYAPFFEFDGIEEEMDESEMPVAVGERIAKKNAIRGGKEKPNTYEWPVRGSGVMDTTARYGEEKQLAGVAGIPFDSVRAIPASGVNATPILKINFKDKSKKGDIGVFHSENVPNIDNEDDIEKRMEEEIKRLEKKYGRQTEEKNNPPGRARQMAKESPQKRKELDEAARRVLDYLNQEAGTMYKYKDQHLKFIRARLREGFTEKALMAVVDCKVHDWGKDPKMWEYLRPKTLFHPDNFESYLWSIRWEPHELDELATGKTLEEVKHAFHRGCKQDR